MLRAAAHAPILSSTCMARRFKAFAGSAAKKNDPKSMQARRSQLRGQIEESGEEVEE